MYNNVRIILSGICLCTVIMCLTMTCNNSNKKQTQMKDNSLTTQELIKYTQLAINPKYENWILFENGTSIIIEDTSDSKEIKTQGLEKMKKFGPVRAGGSAGDFNVITLKETEGWLVSGHGYGMYTYVHPKELPEDNPDDYVIGLYGRSKRNLDGLHFKILCISSNGQITTNEAQNTAP